MTTAYRNGSDMPPIPSPSPLQIDLRTEIKKLASPAKMIMTVWSIVLVLVSTLVANGWLQTPAKSGDLDIVKAQTERLEKSVDNLATRVEMSLHQLGVKVESLQADQQRSREELIRIGTARPATAELAMTPGVVGKPTRRKRKSSPAKPAKEQPGIFGSALQ